MWTVFGYFPFLFYIKKTKILYLIACGDTYLPQLPHGVSY